MKDKGGVGPERGFFQGNSPKGAKTEVGNPPYNVIAAVVSFIWIVNIIFLSWLFCGRDNVMKIPPEIEDRILLSGPKHTKTEQRQPGTDFCGDCEDLALKVDKKVEANASVTRNRHEGVGICQRATRGFPFSGLRDSHRRSDRHTLKTTARQSPISARNSQSSRLFTKSSLREEKKGLSISQRLHYGGTGTRLSSQSWYQPRDPYPELKFSTCPERQHVRTPQLQQPVLASPVTHVAPVTSGKEPLVNQEEEECTFQKKRIILSGESSKEEEQVKKERDDAVQKEVKKLQREVSEMKQDVEEFKQDKQKKESPSHVPIAGDVPMEGQAAVSEAKSQPNHNLSQQMSPHAGSILRHRKPNKNKHCSQHDVKEKHDVKETTRLTPTVDWHVYDIRSFATIPERVLEVMTCPRSDDCGHDHSRYRVVGCKIYVSPEFAVEDPNNKDGCAQVTELNNEILKDIQGKTSEVKTSENCVLNKNKPSSMQDTSSKGSKASQSVKHFPKRKPKQPATGASLLTFEKQTTSSENLPDECVNFTKSLSSFEEKIWDDKKNQASLRKRHYTNKAMNTDQNKVYSSQMPADLRITKSQKKEMHEMWTQMSLSSVAKDETAPNVLDTSTQVSLFQEKKPLTIIAQGKHNSPPCPATERKRERKEAASKHCEYDMKIRAERDGTQAADKNKASVIHSEVHISTSHHISSPSFNAISQFTKRYTHTYPVVSQNHRPVLSPGGMSGEPVNKIEMTPLHVSPVVQKEQKMPPPPTGYHIRNDFSTSETTMEVLKIKQKKDKKNPFREDSPVKSPPRKKNRQKKGLEEERGISRSQLYAMSARKPSASSGKNPPVGSQSTILSTEKEKEGRANRERTNKFLIIGKLNYLRSGGRDRRETMVPRHVPFLKYADDKADKSNVNQDIRCVPSGRSRKHCHTFRLCNTSRSAHEQAKKLRRRSKYEKKAASPKKTSRYFPLSKNSILYYYKPLSPNVKSNKTPRHSQRRHHSSSAQTRHGNKNLNHNAFTAYGKARGYTPSWRFSKLPLHAIISCNKISPICGLNTNTNAGGSEEATAEIDAVPQVEVNKPVENAVCLEECEQLASAAKTVEDESDVVVFTFHESADLEPQDPAHSSSPTLGAKTLVVEGRQTTLEENKQDTVEGSAASTELPLIKDESIESGLSEETEQKSKKDAIQKQFVKNKKKTKTSETLFIKFESSVSKKFTTTTVIKDARKTSSGHNPPGATQSKSDHRQQSYQSESKTGMNNLDKSQAAVPANASPLRHSKILKFPDGPLNIADVTDKPVLVGEVPEMHKTETEPDLIPLNDLCNSGKQDLQTEPPAGGKNLPAVKRIVRSVQLETKPIPSPVGRSNTDSRNEPEANATTKFVKDEQSKPASLTSSGQTRGKSGSSGQNIFVPNSDTNDLPKQVSIPSETMRGDTPEDGMKRENNQGEKQEEKSQIESTSKKIRPVKSDAKNSGGQHRGSKKEKTKGHKKSGKKRAQIPSTGVRCRLRFAKTKDKKAFSDTEESGAVQSDTKKTKSMKHAEKEKKKKGIIRIPSASYDGSRVASQTTVKKTTSLSLDRKTPRSRSGSPANYPLISRSASTSLSPQRKDFRSLSGALVEKHGEKDRPCLADECESKAYKQDFRRRASSEDSSAKPEWKHEWKVHHQDEERAPSPCRKPSRESRDRQLSPDKNLDEGEAALRSAHSSPACAEVEDLAATIAAQALSNANSKKQKKSNSDLKEAELGWNSSPISDCQEKTSVRAKPRPPKKKLKYKLVKAKPKQPQSDLKIPLDLEMPSLQRDVSPSLNMREAGDNAEKANKDMKKSEFTEAEKILPTEGRVVQFSDSVETFGASSTDGAVGGQDFDGSLQRDEESFVFPINSPQNPNSQMQAQDSFCSDVDVSDVQKVTERTKPPQVQPHPLPKRKIPVWVRNKNKTTPKEGTKIKRKQSPISGKDPKLSFHTRSHLAGTTLRYHLSPKTPPQQDNTSVVYNTKVNSAFELKPLDKSTRKIISEIGSPVDIKEIIEGSSVDAPEHQGKRRSFSGILATKSAPHVGIKKAKQLDSKDYIEPFAGRRPKSAFDKAGFASKRLALKKPDGSTEAGAVRLPSAGETTDGNTRVLTRREGSPKAQRSPRLSHSTDLDQAAGIKIKPVTFSKSVPHWSRPPRRDFKGTKKPKSASGLGSAGVDGLSLSADQASREANTDGLQCSDRMDFNVLNLSLSWVVQGVLNKLSSLNFSRLRRPQDGVNAAGDSTPAQAGVPTEIN